MEIFQIRYFVTVVECGGFSRAGTVLRVSQPSISRAIGLLERELGPLLAFKIKGLSRRKERTARPTELGETLLPHFQRLLQQVGNIRTEARVFRRPACNENATCAPGQKNTEVETSG